MVFNPGRCTARTQISSPGSANTNRAAARLTFAPGPPILRAQKTATIKQLRKRSNPANPTQLPLGAAPELLVHQAVSEATSLTIVLVLLVRGRVARFTVPAAPGGFPPLPGARRSGAVDMVLTGWDGVGTAACRGQRQHELAVPKHPSPTAMLEKAPDAPRKGTTFLTQKPHRSVGCEQE